jgi:hypothetical protein
MTGLQNRICQSRSMFQWPSGTVPFTNEEEKTAKIYKKLNKISNFHFLFYTLDEILGDQFNKRRESFAPCYSQSLLLADFKENHTIHWF